MWNSSLPFQKKGSFAQDIGGDSEQSYYQDSSISYNMPATGGGVYGYDLNYLQSMNSYKVPNIESDNNFLTGNSQYTDDRIGEWLAKEEASLDEIPMNYYEDNSKMFHHNQVGV
jgi:hypothetical protein